MASMAVNGLMAAMIVEAKEMLASDLLHKGELFPQNKRIDVSL